MYFWTRIPTTNIICMIQVVDIVCTHDSIRIIIAKTIWVTAASGNDVARNLEPHAAPFCRLDTAAPSW